MNNKQSEFLELNQVDNSSYIDVTSGLPIKNRKIKADNLIKSDLTEESKYTAASTLLLKSTKEELEQLIETTSQAHLTDFNNPHQVTKEQLGLSEVDNTSDINKPISTAQQVALNNKIDLNGLNSNIDKLYFNPSTLSALTSIGDVRFSPYSKTLEVKVSDTVSIQLGQEMQTRVKNNAGVQINNGALVYIDSAVGANPLAKLATTANGDIAQRTYGMATEDIASNGFGAITTEGLVNGLNTSAFADGAMLYLSTNGTFTATEPVAPTPKISIGMVLRSHQNQGVVYVKIRAVARNQKLSDVYAPTITGGDVLRWNSSTLRFETFNVTSALGLKTDKATQVIAGTGLTGGGDLSADRTINIAATDDSIVIAADGVKVDTQNLLTSTSVTKPLAANQGKVLNDNLVQLGANFNTSVADEKSMFPAIAYNKRVLADGGTVISKQSVIDGYKTMIDLLPNTDLLICPEAGVKIRTSGIYSYVSKAYDMGVNGLDVTQNIEVSQPYLYGNIAPNESKSLKSIQGESRYISTPLINKTATDKWSINIVLRCDGSLPKDNLIQDVFGRSGGCSFRVQSSTNQLSFVSENIVGSQSTMMISNLIGTTMIVSIIADGNGGLQFWLNGKLIESFPALTNRTTLSIDRLLGGRSSQEFQFKGNIYYFQVLNKNLSKSEIENQYTYLRSQYPEIEGVNIGNQHWATSNYEGVVTGNGTVIPEVKGESTASNPELFVNGGFDTDTVWKKQTGWSISGGTANAVNASNYINQSGVVSKSKQYILTFTLLNYSSGSLRSVFGSDASTYSEYYTSNGTYTRYIKSDITNGSVDFFGVNFTGSIDNVSIKEVGWADLTTPAWCYYNNDPVLGSVYGKLYNYYAVQAIAANPPKGWRVPTSADFTQLSTFLGGDAVSGGKLKKEGLVYWASPNTGATNESGFSVLGSGGRNGVGTFTDIGNKTYIRDINGIRIVILNNEQTASSGPTDNRVGMNVRLIRNSPVGNQTQNISTGVFTTNIAAGTANKDLNIPFGYEVKAINVLATTAITNFKCDLYNTSGGFQQNLVTGKSASANVPIKFGVSADANIQYTDPILRFNCTGNSGSGMEIQVILNKIL